MGLPDGILQVALGMNGPSSTADGKLVRLGTSGVVCDVGQGRIFWVEEGTESTSLLQAHITGPQHGAQAVHTWDHDRIRYGADGELLTVL